MEPIDSMLTSDLFCNPCQSGVPGYFHTPAPTCGTAPLPPTPAFASNNFSKSPFMAAVSHRKTCLCTPALAHPAHPVGILMEIFVPTAVMREGFYVGPLVPAAEQESAESPIASDRPPRNSQTHSNLASDSVFSWGLERWLSGKELEVLG